MKNKEQPRYILTGGKDDGKTFIHSDDLIKHLRDGGVDEDNDCSDDFLFDESYQLGEFEQIELSEVHQGVIKFLEGLVQQRFSIEALNIKLSRFFGEKIEVYNASQGRIDSGEADDELADWNLMFNIDAFSNPKSGFYDIYVLPMRREGFDGSTMYITEVGFEFI